MVLKMERLKPDTKWFSTVASIWIQCTSGSLYTFPIYSSTLKSTQGYDQSTLDTVSVSKDIGANCGILAGVLYTYATSRRGRGPWLVHLAGAIQCFAGYFFIWAAVTGLIPRPPVAVMCWFMFLAAHAQSFFNTADVVTAVRNFPDYSGTAVGIMKGFIGLSGAILIQAYQTLFDNRPTLFILMLAVLPSVNSLSLMSFVRIHNMSEGDEKRYLDRFSSMSLILGVYLMIIILLEKILGFKMVASIIIIVVLLVLLVSPLFIEIKAPERSQIKDKCKMLSSEDPIEYRSLPSDAEHDVDTTYVKDSLEIIDELNLLQAACTLDYWILFLATACGMGSGLTTVNNMSQIGGSLGYMSFEINTLISLWSIWNFVGRFGAGYVSDYFLRLKGWARPLFMAITLALMSIGQMVIASGLPGALYAGSVLVGICYGSQWSLMPTICSEIFGVKHMGTIFNAIAVACPVGSYIFSVRVVGYIYDKEASGEGNTCIGSHCFMLAFLIMACAALIGSLVALVLFFRTRNFYHRVIIRRLLHPMRK